MKQSLAFFALIFALAARGDESPQGLAFSTLQPQAAFPADWREVRLSGVTPVRYSLVRDEGITVLRAESDAAMSSLSRRIDVDPMRYPNLRWRWKIANLLERSDMRSKSGDDFPARVYVSFQYDLSRLPFLQRSRLRIARAFYGPDVPAAVLCYVWDGVAPRGTIAVSPYTDRVRVVVATSGPHRVGEWVEVERNLVDDYRAAFGEAPGRVDGIALAADTDNTGSQAVSHFGDIAFLAAERR